MFSTPTTHYNEQSIDSDSKNQVYKLPSSRQRLKENSRLLPQQAIDIMTHWYEQNYKNPYPTFQQCEYMANQGQITISQVKQWFVNIRRRTQNEFRKKRSCYNYKKTQTSTNDNTTSSSNSSSLLSNHFNDESNFDLDFNPIQYDEKSTQSMNNNSNYESFLNYQQYQHYNYALHSTPYSGNYNYYISSKSNKFSESDSSFISNNTSSSPSSSNSSCLLECSFTNVTPYYYNNNNISNDYYSMQYFNNYSTFQSIPNCQNRTHF